MYGLTSGKDNSVRIYDARDSSVTCSIALKNHNIAYLHHVTSLPLNKTYYWCFVMTVQDSEGACFTGLYFIKNTTLVKALNSSSTLTEDDCLMYISHENEVPHDLLTAKLYFDSDTAGDSQIILCVSDSLALAHSIVRVLALDANNRISPVAEFENANPRQLMKTDISEVFNAGTIRYVVSPNGDHIIILRNHGGSSVDQSYTHEAELIYKYTYRSSVIVHTFFKFDPESKRFSIEEENYLYIHVPVKVPEGAKGVHLISGFPAALYASSIPDFALSESEEQVRIEMKGIRVFYSAVFADQPAVEDFPTVKIGANVLLCSHYIKVLTKDGGYTCQSGSEVDIITEDTTDIGIVTTNSKTISESLTYKNRLFQGYFSMKEVDFLGNSLTVGSPILTYDDKTTEVLGLYRCLPFDSQAQTNLPTLSVSTSKGVVNGISKSTNTSWHAGYSVSAGFSGALGSCNAHFGQSWGSSKMNMSSDQKSISVHLTTGNSKYDILHGYNSGFYLWEYPLFHSVQERSPQGTTTSPPIGYLTVLIPDGFIDSSLDTKDKRFSYDQDYEIGKILTYVNSAKPGYKLENLWFEKQAVTVTSDSQGGGSIIVYSKQNSTHKDVQTSKDDGFNAGSSVNLSVGGFNASVSGYYTKNNVKNSATSTVRTDELTISVHTGSTKDSGYDYLITPLIYTHTENNMLLVCCDVELIGPLWKKLYATPDVIMMRVFPFTEDSELNAFTRSIRFAENKDGTVDINLHLFSNSRPLHKSYFFQ